VSHERPVCFVIESSVGELVQALAVKVVVNRVSGVSWKNKLSACS